MKNFKRLVAIFAMLALVFSFAGCNIKATLNKGSNDKEKADPETEARAVAKNFAEDFVTFDTKKIEKYFENSDELNSMKEGLEMFSSMDDLIIGQIQQQMAGQLGQLELSAAEIEQLADKVMECVREKTSVEIGTAQKVADDEIVFEIKTTTVSQKATDMQPDISEEEIMEIMEAEFGFDLTNQQLLLEKWCEKEGVSSPEELQKKYSNDEEAQTGMMKAFSKEFRNLFFECVNLFIDKWDIPTESMDGTITMKKVDGDWKITKTE